MKKDIRLAKTPKGNFVVNIYDLIGRFIAQKGEWESHLYDFYSGVINHNDVIIDAGANLGYHTVQFGFLGKKVYAFEPQSLVFNQLCSNALFNDLNDKIVPFKCALGDKTEVKQMWSIENENFGNEIYNWGGRGLEHEQSAHNSNEFREHDQVQVITLDSLNIPSVDLIKIDIQGYEYYAFLGAKKLIEDNKPIILLENEISDKEMDAQALTFLKELGYENYRYYINNNEDCILIHPESNKYGLCLEQISEMDKKYKIKKEF